jgi:hypothetical protein
MHSLWRTLALQWLGGDGSEALTGDSAVLEGLVLGSNERPVRTFYVRREPQVSRYAMMLADPERPFDPEVATEEVLRSQSIHRYSR